MVVVVVVIVIIIVIVIITSQKGGHTRWNDRLMCVGNSINGTNLGHPRVGITRTMKGAFRD